MGRTTPTYRSYLDAYEAEWAPFRRALRHEHRPAFDRVFARARLHADAAGNHDPPDPRFAVLLSVLVAQERELATLREAVAEELDATLDPDPARDPESPAADAGAGRHR